MNYPLQFQHNKPLKDVSTFAIGGPARLFVTVSSIEDMRAALLYCKAEKIPFFILGKGSNCLFHDLGFNGLVIQNKISYLHIEDSSVDVGSGYSFSMLGFKTAKAGLAGLEFASGIPATVGGAIFMNAGANGAETASCLQEVSFMDEQGQIHLYHKEDLSFGYRFSSFQEKRGAIVSAKFILTPSEEARQKQCGIVEYRKNTQPYSEHSAGCVFRNPSGQSAGALIDKTGLKGLAMGDAEVSSIHANFIINRGDALAEEILLLVEEVQKQVLAATGVALEMEVRCIPYQMS